jgi:hypothetical protein
MYMLDSFLGAAQIALAVLDRGPAGSTVNGQIWLRRPIRHLSRRIALFPVLFALLEYASSGESCAAVLVQTWLYHHFFPT